MKQYLGLITLCILLSMFLLNGCGKQPSEETLPADTQPSTQTTQPQTESAGDLEEGELPALTIPQQTEPVTQPTEGTPAPEATQPIQEPKPPADTEPTQPPEPTEPPRLDENELPPIPVG